MVRRYPASEVALRGAVSPLRTPRGLLGLALVMLVTWPAAAEPSHPYVYQRGGLGVVGSAAVELESAYGSRDARPFGAAGFEQGARVRWSPLDWLSAEGWGGVLVSGGAHRATAGALDLRFTVLRQDAHHVDLTLSGGALFDYRRALVPRLGATLRRAWGAFDACFSTFVEVPTSGDRDAVDLALAFASSYAPAAWARVGLEVEGQDLEGFWEPGEAEGGARLVAGPTAWLGGWKGLYAKLNVGAIVPATRTPPARVAPGVDPAAFDYGVLGRLILGWSVR